MVEYTTEQAEACGFSKEIPSTLMGTWDTESNAKRMLHILFVVPTEKMLREAMECEVFPKLVEICIQFSDLQVVRISILEVPLWAVPKEIGYNFLLVEEIDPEDCTEEYVEKLVIVETMKTYQEVEEKRAYLLSS